MDNTREILRKRAADAAKKVEEKGVIDGVEIIRFKIGNEVYAVEALLVDEVHAFIDPVAVPYIPAYIEGIVNIRGRFVSVVNMKRFLGLEEGEAAHERFLLFLSDGLMEFGVVVDEVLDEIRLSKKMIRPIPQGFALAKKELIAGVTEEGTILVDGGKFLNDPAMTVHQEVATPSKGRENVT